jgi:hypothetical protein
MQKTMTLSINHASALCMSSSWDPVLAPLTLLLLLLYLLSKFRLETKLKEFSGFHGCFLGAETAIRDKSRTQSLKKLYPWLSGLFPGSDRYRDSCLVSCICT